LFELLFFFGYALIVFSAKTPAGAAIAPVVIDIFNKAIAAKLINMPASFKAASGVVAFGAIHFVNLNLVALQNKYSTGGL
jgi:hypothetical protein